VRSRMFDYWHTFVDLLRFRDVVRTHLDHPLQSAISQSRWAAAWTGAVVVLAAWLRWPQAEDAVLNQLQVPTHVRAVIDVGILLLALSFAIPAVYGFLRLYTLVHHVMVMNVFRCRRGQRLRLLNFYSSTLPLAVPVAAGVDIAAVSRAVGWALIGAAAAYYIYLTSVAYNRIFHRQKLGGFGLWLGGTVLTWFVLLIGAIGIAAALAVVSFFALAVMRVFAHR
jgi:hypothetical protein